VSAERYLLHVTLSSGHVRKSPRSEVADDVITVLRPLLSRALTGDHAPILGYTITGGVHGRCCAITFWRVDELTGRVPVITVGVAPHSRCGAHLWRSLHEDLPPGSVVRTSPDDVPQEPWCAARLDIGAAALGPDQMMLFGDLERCIAWTWIEMR
jgi:hypothetical protein